jgi:membrane protein
MTGGALKRTIVSAVDGFSDDELMTRAAALAFYAALSFAPLLLLLVWVISVLHPEWRDQLTQTLSSVVGSRAAGAIDTVIASAKAHPRLSDIAGVVGLGVTLFAASAVFAQLQGTLDRVWRVKARPGEAVGAWLRARGRAFALLGGMAFMMIVSFIVSAIIQTVIRGDSTAWSAVEYLISVVVFVAAFGAMYKVLPDAVIDWSEALIGAVLTTALFLAGKYVIGLYIQYSDVGGAYGPAGAFVVLLTWTYYSSIIVLLGAELTRGVADARGKPIRPSAHAVEIEAAPAEVKPQDSQRAALARTGRARPGRIPRVAVAGSLIAVGVVLGTVLGQGARRRRPGRGV